MKILLFLTLIGLGFIANASEGLTWNEGVLVLTDGRVKQGAVAFQVSEIVLFRVNGEVTVYTANKIHSFRYFDAKANINRKFISLSSENIRVNTIYEVVVVGKVSVLRKFKTNNINGQRNSDKDDFDYFVRCQNYTYNLSQFRNKVYPNLISTAGELMSQIKEKHLNPNLDADAIQIVELFNKITESSQLVAGI